MFRQPTRQAVLAVRAVKVAATGTAAGVALGLVLVGADAGSSGTDADRAAADSRCAGSAGKAIVRTPEGVTQVVSFERGWKVYRGERPGSLVVVCPD